MKHLSEREKEHTKTLLMVAESGFEIVATRCNLFFDGVGEQNPAEVLCRIYKYANEEAAFFRAERGKL